MDYRIISKEEKYYLRNMDHRIISKKEKYYLRNMDIYFDFNGYRGIHYYFGRYRGTCIIEYANFLKNKCPEVLFSKDNDGKTFLHCYFICRREVKEENEHIFNFTKKYFPSLFLEKDNFGNTILHNLFCSYTSLQTINFFLEYLRNNVPEILTNIKYHSNKNLILPLTFQIHN